MLSAFRVQLGGGENLPLPALTLDRPVYTSGESIVATFAASPGNATDWLGLYRATDIPGAPSSRAQAWFYTNNRQRANGPSGPTLGEVLFDDRSGPVWPLPEGDYQAFFLCCDGYAILAGPIAFTIAP